MDLSIAIAAFALGLCFGSFLNVCIYRLPLGKSVVTPRSACPHCGDMIPLYHNLPVISWMVLRGKCRACKQPISPRYLVVEILTALLFLGCYLYFGLTLAALKCVVLGYLLLGLIFTDAETELLPDAMTLPGIILGIAFSLIVPVNDLASRIIPGLIPAAMRGEISWRLWSLSDSLLGAAVGASFLYGAAAIYLRARGVEGMGFGDVKLMALIGAFLGTRLTVLTIFASSLAGSFFGLKHRSRSLAETYTQKRLSGRDCYTMRGGGRGNQRDLRCVITKCRLVSFSVPWPLPHSFLVTGCCIGIGGDSEPSGQSTRFENGSACFNRHYRLRAWFVPDAPASKEFSFRFRFVDVWPGVRRRPAGARLSFSHPATQAAEARTGRPTSFRAT